jgi:hypothetical protein
MLLTAKVFSKSEEKTERKGDNGAPGAREPLATPATVPVMPAETEPRLHYVDTK